MFQVKISKEFIDLDEKTVIVLGKDDKMLIYEDREALEHEDSLFSLDIPEYLKYTFNLIPEKRGYIRKDEYGDVFFTLIRFLDYHIHSEYSLLDGANKVKNIVEKSEGCTAITDHGVMFGCVDFFVKMYGALKKPVIGIEVYTETSESVKDSCHMILLVKNTQGWKNVCKIISEAETNFYRKPQVSYEMLEKYHEGLICTSACIGGEIPQLILSNQLEKAEEVIEILQGIFGDDFYLEIQQHNLGSEEETVNNYLEYLGGLYDIKLVGAIDSHYTDKEDAYAHEILLSIGTKKKLSDPNRYKFQGDNYYLRTADEFESLFEFNPELISNTLEIVDKCNFMFDLKTKNMPKYDVPAEFKDEAEYFEHLCWEGFDFRYKGTDLYEDQERIDRLKYEIKTIISTGFPGYFCIVWDYVKWAKDNGIYVGPGRGSCVGSLAAYCLRITELDPILYGLLFERFINPERISPPDIDMDFQEDRRHEVIDYIKNKYGEDHVSNIITFGTLAARNVIRDVGRVLEYDNIYIAPNVKLIDKLAKSVPAEVNMTLEKALKTSPDFRELYETNPQAKEVIDIAKRLEGLSRNKSKHACGVIVANAPINEYVPEVLMDSKENKGEKVRVAGFIMTELESLGLLKMDVRIVR